MARPPRSTPASEAPQGADPDFFLRQRVQAYLDRGATAGPDPDAPRDRVLLLLHDGGWLSVRIADWERVRPR